MSGFVQQVKRGWRGSREHRRPLAGRIVSVRNCAGIIGICREKFIANMVSGGYRANWWTRED